MYEQLDFATPTETRDFPNGRVDVLQIGGAEIGRLTLQPGWRWSTDVKPIAGTDLCEAPHFQYHVAGTLRVRTAEGVEFDATPGQVTALPSGHDAWVVGDEPVVVVDWWGASNYARGDTSHSDTVQSDTVQSDTVQSDTVQSDTVQSDTVRSAS